MGSRGAWFFSATKRENARVCIILYQSNVPAWCSCNANVEVAKHNIATKDTKMLEWRLELAVMTSRTRASCSRTLLRTNSSLCMGDLACCNPAAAAAASVESLAARNISGRQDHHRHHQPARSLPAPLVSLSSFPVFILLSLVLLPLFFPYSFHYILCCSTYPVKIRGEKKHSAAATSILIVFCTPFLFLSCVYSFHNFIGVKSWRCQFT